MPAEVGQRSLQDSARAVTSNSIQLSMGTTLVHVCLYRNTFSGGRSMNNNHSFPVNTENGHLRAKKATLEKLFEDEARELLQATATEDRALSIGDRSRKRLKSTKITEEEEPVRVPRPELEAHRYSVVIGSARQLQEAGGIKKDREVGAAIHFYAQTDPSLLAPVQRDEPQEARHDALLQLVANGALRVGVPGEGLRDQKTTQPVDKLTSSFQCRCRGGGNALSNRSCCSDPELLWLELAFWNRGPPVATGNGHCPEETNHQHLQSCEGNVRGGEEEQEEDGGDKRGTEKVKETAFEKEMKKRRKESNAEKKIRRKRPGMEIRI
ncbi:hypothetical protein EYF80_025954 [Liparis tanakae]|uniref:Uncharacterized protein n=1 Tax=Liparis tanakae TaxID=230148 RepID=A0A4Z2HDP8_9TELE|nr:hypothetical protein EYF80_025954 [Liparis tanakae]